MKKQFFTALLFIAATVLTHAQSPLKFNYQGIARNNAGLPLASQNLGIRISIIDLIPGGSAVYSETHSATTNAYGLYSLAVGGGTVVSGSMNTVPWNSGDKFIKVEIDPAGGTSYTDMGTTQLLSVPFALYALNSAAGPKTYVSSFLPPGCKHLAAVTSTMQKIDDMGTFTKMEDSTFIEIRLQTILHVSTFAGAAGVVFELRIDDMPTTIGRITSLIRTAGTYDNHVITGVFKSLSAGTHTVSLWARSVNGTATDAYWDPGCFNNFGTNDVLIKEFH